MARQLLPPSVFQDLDEQDSTHGDGTEISLVDSADGETSFHPRNGEGKAHLSVFFKGAGHEVPAAQPGYVEGEDWSCGVDRLPAHGSAQPGVAAAPSCLGKEISAGPLAWGYNITRADLRELLLKLQSVSSQHL